MRAERFLDTNILLYAYDLDSPIKRRISQSFLEKAWVNPGSTAISVQVLQEFYVNFVRSGHSASEVATLIEDFSRWTVIENTLELLRQALVQQTRWQLSLWDSLILAAAQTSGAHELITEDLNHGQDYSGVRVINPFRS